MSTRESIVYVPPVHIFREALSCEICIELLNNTSKNEKYGDPILNFDHLKKIRKEITEFLGDEKEKELVKIEDLKNLIREIRSMLLFHGDSLPERIHASLRWYMKKLGFD